MATNAADAVSLIVKLWRPLSTAEAQRATALAESVERDITRRWPLVPTRLASGELKREDLLDVLAWMVLPLLGGPPYPGARSWQVTSGSESRSVTLDAAGDPRDPWVYATWMRDILDGAAAPGGAHAQGSFPEPAPFEDLFPSWPEVYRS